MFGANKLSVEKMCINIKIIFFKRILDKNMDEIFIRVRLFII